MTRKTVAVELCDLVFAARRGLATAYPEAGKQLRALLAVARAADDLVTTVTPTTEHARLKVFAVNRALDRLARASAPRKR